MGDKITVLLLSIRGWLAGTEWKVANDYAKAIVYGWRREFK
jgi:hypothetical protein